MHAGMVARALIEPRLRIPVTVSIASEFRYEEPLIDDSTLTIVISQSGETIDTLAALRLARECGSTVISVVNVKGSTIARESDYVIYTHGGPEIAVASTKPTQYRSLPSIFSSAVWHLYAAYTRRNMQSSS